MKRISLFLIGLCVVAACNKQEDKPAEAGKSEKSPCAQLEAEVQQLRKVSAEKDSLAREAMEMTQFMNDVYSQLVKVKGNGNDVSQATKEGIRAKVQVVVDKLAKTEARARSLKNQLSSEKDKSSGLSKQIEMYLSQIDAFKADIERQKSEIESLGIQVKDLTAKNTQLSTELTSEKETTTKLTTERDTKYYIIGTVDQLEEWGIIEKKGKTLFFGGKWVPKQGFSKDKFKSVNKNDVIPFPAEYEVVTAHEVSLLTRGEQQRSEARVVVGMKPKNADEFWAPSPYLIIIDKE